MSDADPDAERPMPVPSIRISLLSLALLTAIILESTSVGAQPSEQARYRAAAEYSRRNRGDAVLVMRGDRIVFEDYQNGYDRAEPHLLASGTKSFSCALAAAAIEDGMIGGWDEPAARTLGEWSRDPRKGRITVRHLLDLSSGLDPSFRQLQGRRVRNKNLAALAVPMLGDPGERFRYGPAHYYAFGELLRRRLEPRRETVMRYLERRVLRPIGMTATIRADAAGNPNLPGGGFATAREWAKFGRLLRDGGRWNGRQLLRADLLRECIRPSAANPSYGLTLWLNPTRELSESLAADRPLRRREDAPSPWTRPAGPNPNQGIYMAAGAMHQRLYVIPRENLVVVRFGRGGQGWNDAEFLDLLLGRK